jgi:uncharacterized metal-binding protein
MFKEELKKYVETSGLVNMKEAGDLLVIGVPSFDGETDHWVTQATAGSFLRKEGVTNLKWHHGSGSTQFYFGRCNEEKQSWLILKGCTVKNMTPSLTASVKQKIDLAIQDLKFDKIELQEIDIEEMFISAIREKFGVND